MTKWRMVWQIIKSAGNQIWSVLLVKPINEIKDLQADFWSEDEPVDGFVKTVRDWRSEPPYNFLGALRDNTFDTPSAQSKETMNAIQVS